MGRLPFLFLSIASLAASMAAARGAEIHVVSQANVKSALARIIAQFEKETGDKVTTAFGNPGVTLERLRKGERADVVIVSTTILDTVLKEALIEPATRVEIARSKIGLAVGAAAPMPVMTDRASFIALVRRLKRIALVDPATGGGTSPPFIKAVEALGVAAEIAPKYRFYKGAGDAVAEAVARGEAEAGVTAISELKPNPGLRLVGPIPADVLDFAGTTSASLGAKAVERAAAARFVAFLASPFAREAFIASGME